MKLILNSKMRYELRCELYDNQYTKYTPKEYRLLGQGVFAILVLYIDYNKRNLVNKFYYVLCGI